MEKSEAVQNPEKNNSESTTRNDGKNQSDDANLDSKSKNNQHIYSQVQSTENHDKMNHVQNKSDLVNPIELGVISKKDEQERPNKILKAVEIVKELSKYILKQEKGSLTFDLKPEHLGQLKITLDTVDKVLKARIEVDNEHAKLMLEKNLDKLHQELNDNGVKLNSLNISLGNYKKQKEERIGRTKNQSQTKDLGQVGESEEENNKKSFGYNTYEYIA
jgi:flagellar hook-length control protein FliK